MKLSVAVFPEAHSPVREVSATKLVIDVSKICERLHSSGVDELADI